MTRSKWLLLSAAAIVSLATLAAACGGGGDDGDNGDDGTRTVTVPTRSPIVRGTQSPAAGGTAGASGTPAPAPTVDPNQPTPNGDISGGDPNAAPQVVATLPPPPPGVTPHVDPTEIAPPNPDTDTLSFVVDMDAGTAGIQTSREVNVGDEFRVAVVVVNVPPRVNDIGGLNAFNFFLDYDKTKIIAPTYSGGDPTDRNPDLNLPALGPDAGWLCLPAPEGDIDDPGGIDGDGNPATGRALLSCFAPGTGAADGDLVLATVTFRAVASGSLKLELHNVVAGDALGIGIGKCVGDQDDAPEVPCLSGDLTVR
jgi:hypothetical protein